ncbi:MAG: DNA/RNA nuclease SfsA [Butyrivibrio sp.]|nr:DNA/RNA nuclease SfsA [Butyrivibrio sp.]
MKYKNIYKAEFISRPNRFIAIVRINDEEIKVHVKNTGRCRELLLPGSSVYLEKADNPDRKTPYDLVAVEHNGKIVNIDSQAPNAVVKEWLLKQDYTNVYPEYRFGNSRIDFYMEKDEVKFLLEVKGCTLFRDGVGYFPDAPTERGTKHLRELTGALKQGYHAMVGFVIQGEGISEVRPNADTDPEFAKAFYEAKEAGVEILFLKCRVNPDSLEIE